MPEEPDEDFPPPGAEDEAADPGRRRPAWWKLVFFSMLVVFLLTLAAGWFTRERIAQNLISGELDSLGIPATYEIVSIGARRQIIANLVLGDPERPDLTIERIEVEVEPRLGLPGIGRLTLVRPRLRGSFHDGKLSFGSLNPVVFGESEEPFSLPGFDLVLSGGRGLIESDYGPIGLMAEGKGVLSNGFAGEIAAAAPALAVDGCTAKDASLYARISTKAGKPRLAGPVRLAGFACPDGRARIGKSALEADITLDKALDGAEGQIALKAGPLAYGANRLAAVDGTSRFTWRGEGLTARYKLEGNSAVSPQAKAAGLSVEGRVRGLGNFGRLEVEGDVAGRRLELGAGLNGALAAVSESGKDTLAGDVAAQVRTALLREGRASSLNGSFIMRRTGKTVSLVVPRGTVRGSSGQALLSVSRLQFRSGGSADLHVTGNFATGGRQLPKLAGRMERSSAGRLMMRVRMPEYQAGSARLEIPELTMVQLPQGAVNFSGEARVSGALPGGSAENLAIPLEGDWSDGNGLSLWRKCVTLRFDRLELAQIALERRALPVCPPRGGAIVRSTAQGLKAAAGVPALDLAGHLGEAPVRITSGPVGFAWPGVLNAREIKVSLGASGAESTFRLARLGGRLGDDISGTFEGADMSLDAVPLDIRDAAGAWRFADGVLTIGEGALRVEDREQVDRFEPLVAQDAALSLAENVITGEAVLREPASGREVVRMQLRHDLSSGSGSADLHVDRLLFDERVQPDTLTHLALGVIANADGIVRGQGRIDWDEEAVTSTGSFTTDSLDFAAAFGPVDGVSGTVTFTDLLGLVTAPDQRLHIASINPGIEVDDGSLSFALKPDYVLQVNGAKWPFQGGTLALEPVTMNLGTDDPMRYDLTIEGLDAARVVQHLDLGNIAATGTFDGSLPLVFDQDGGRIEGGHLKARAPGGNVSYVGQLSYKDLSTMANFAFEALKSLDYRQMRIDLDGSLEGEIVTRVTFEGIRQGKEASSNFVTRQVAKLPIQFKVNIRAPFMQLVTSMRSLYDPAYIRDPRTLGLLDAIGQPTRPPAPELPENRPNPAIRPPSTLIQHPESDELP